MSSDEFIVLYDIYNLIGIPLSTLYVKIGLETLNRVVLKWLVDKGTGDGNLHFLIPTAENIGDPRHMVSSFPATVV